MPGQASSAMDDALSVEKFREMLEVAAKIKDRNKSITIFYLLVMMGRVGMRVGEVIHAHYRWYDEHRNVVSIPPHEDCSCGFCRGLARQYIKDKDDITVEEALENWWRAKEDKFRPVYLPTRRARDIWELYFDTFGHTSISHSTVWRRLTKAAELTEGVDPDNVYPHMMRATAATHLIWEGFAPVALDVQFGWEDEKTRERYTKKSGAKVRKEYRNLFGELPDTEWNIRRDPPTYEELRPDDPDELIEVETWEIDSESPPHPRARDIEELIQLDEFDDSESNDSSNITLIPGASLMHSRLSREYQIAQSTRSITAPSIGDAVAWTAGVTLTGLAMQAVPFDYSQLAVDILSGGFFGTASVLGAAAFYLPFAVWQIHEDTHDNPQEATPKSLGDQIVMKTHRLVAKATQYL